MSLIKLFLASILCGFSFGLLLDSFEEWIQDVPLPE